MLDTLFNPSESAPKQCPLNGVWRMLRGIASGHGSLDTVKKHRVFWQQSCAYSSRYRYRYSYALRIISAMNLEKKQKTLHVGGRTVLGHQASLENDISEKGSTPIPWARGLRDQIQKWALHTTENPLSLGFSVLRGGSRPWSQTMVSEGARPWGRGRSGDCEYKPVKSKGDDEEGTAMREPEPRHN